MRKLLLIGYLLLTSLLVEGQDSGLKERVKLRGYLKFMQTNSFVSIDTILSDNLIHNRLNLKYRSKNKKWSGALELRNRINYGDQYRLIPGYAEQLINYEGAVKMEWIWAETPTWTGTTVIDRFYADYQSDKWEVRLGRQRINWGVNLVWNPNDVFNNFNYLDFDYEERPGSDAVRFRLLGKKMQSLEVAYKWSSVADETVAAVKYKFNKRNYDYQVLGGRFRNNWMLGGGWAGSIGMVGFKGEASLFVPFETNVSDTNTSLSFSPSLDYSFSSGWYILGSYLINTQGATEVMSASGFVRQLPNAKSLMPNKHTALIQASKSFSPVFNGSVTTMYAAGVNWLILFPTLTYSFRSDLDFSLVAQTLFAEKMNGDFSNSGTSIFMRFKYSF